MVIQKGQPIEKFHEFKLKLVASLIRPMLALFSSPFVRIHTVIACACIAYLYKVLLLLISVLDYVPPSHFYCHNVLNVAPLSKINGPLMIR